MEIEALKSGKSPHKIRFPSTGRTRGNKTRPKLPKVDFESEVTEGVDGLRKSQSFTKEPSFLDNVRTITTNEV